MSTQFNENETFPTGGEPDCPFNRPRQIDVVADISYRDFVERYANTLTPVLLRGALSDLPAAEWTMESFRQRWGDKTFEIEGSQYTLAELIDLNLASKTGEPAPYLRSIDIETEVPELIPDLAGGVRYAWPNYRFTALALRRWYFKYGDHFAEFFLGGEGNSFPFLHADYPPINTFIGLFEGVKEWIMFEPEQADRLYITSKGYVKSPIEDIFAPDFDKYPELMQANPVRCVQRAGDLLFMPCNWIHTVRNHKPCLSVGCDQLAASSWESFRADVNQRVANKSRALVPLVGAYLFFLGALLKANEKLTGRFYGKNLRGRII